MRGSPGIRTTIRPPPEEYPKTLPIDDCEHTPLRRLETDGQFPRQDYAHRNELRAASFRMSCIYGPRQVGNEDKGGLHTSALSKLRDEGLTIIGVGKRVRDVRYGEDLFRAYDECRSDPEDNPVVFDMEGGPDNTIILVKSLDLLEDRTGK